MFRRLRKLMGSQQKPESHYPNAIDVGCKVAVMFGESVGALGKVVRAEGVRIHGQWSQLRIVTPHGNLMAARANYVRKLTADEEVHLRQLERDAFDLYGETYKVRRSG